MSRSQGGARAALPFEKPLVALRDELAAARAAAEGGDAAAGARVPEIERRLGDATRDVFARLSAWERVQIARHPDRPLSTDHVERLWEDFTELHGDRRFGDDPAILTGFGKIGGRSTLVVAHRKGKDVKEKMSCHFGMAHPEGYRKAILKMRLAERFGVPIVCLVDTPGAYPGLEAEERGQAWAIAENIQDMVGIRVPIVVAVIGEGGSGGALGIGVGDRVLMMENAYYSVISPEGCAAILWKSGEQAPEAATQLRLTATDLTRLGIVDRVVEEPLGGAQRDPAAASRLLGAAIGAALAELDGVPADELLERRFEKFRRIGSHLFA